MKTITKTYLDGEQVLVDHGSLPDKIKYQILREYLLYLLSINDVDQTICDVQFPSIHDSNFETNINFQNKIDKVISELQKFCTNGCEVQLMKNGSVATRKVN
jgi:hypothetical protein